MQSQSTFLVGTGALGCEFLKNFALMGLATREGGTVHCTDNDRIEVSNLNRQFLFRAKNVGHPKSLTAAEAAKVMNPEFRVNAMEEVRDRSPVFRARSCRLGCWCTLMH
jgi:ubiquitin-activating enzyme E1